MTKTITFAILHFTVAFTVAYLLTGSFVIGGLLALIEPACNTVVFYFHERAWQAFEHKHPKLNLAPPAEKHHYCLGSH